MSNWTWETIPDADQITLGIVGDTNVQDRDDPASAFVHVQGTLRDVDVMIGQWECPLTEAPAPDGQSDIVFKPGWRHARPAMAGALTAAGFRAVSLASNVAYPPAAAAETARHLHAAGIATAGVGANIAEARAPAIVVSGGQTIALLSYTSVFWPIEQPATETTPGVATIRAHTAYGPGRRALEMPGAAPEIRTWADPLELNTMKRDIGAALKRADLVVVSCHWGVSSQEAFVEYQREIAHVAIDAGAGLVYGTHPHRIQAIEVYNQVPIFYSLGNFAFDWQKMQDRHKDGLLVRCVVERGRIRQTSIVPVRRGSDNNIAILNPNEALGKAIIARIVDLSKCLGTRFCPRGNEIRIEQ